jgi:RHS repeat-associated protein
MPVGRSSIASVSVRGLVAALVVSTVATLTLGSGAAFAADPGDGSSDLPNVASVPLPNAPTIADPADQIATLTGSVVLPAEGEGDVSVGMGWVDVPGLPIDVRDDPTSDSGSAALPGVAVGDTAKAHVVSAVALRTSANTSISDSLEQPVTVSLVRPDDATRGDLVLAVTDPEAVPDPATTAPDTSPSAVPGTPVESPTSEATSEPSATDSSSPSALPSASPSESPSASGTDAASESSSPGSSTDPSPSSDEPSPVSPEAADPVSVGGVEVRLDYSGFASLYGGDWSDRLQVYAFPACYAETPEDPACSTAIPVDVVADPVSGSLTFTTVETVAQAQTDAGVAVDEPAPSDTMANPGVAFRTGGIQGHVEQVSTTSTGGVVYAVTAGSANYGALPTSPSASWQVGTGSGEFSYSYPFSLPKPPFGSAPDLSLQYSSGSVDAMTTSENGQGSPAGLGWGLTPGYISRSYTSCADDGVAGKGDMCWKTTSGQVVNELNIVLNGHATTLSHVGTSDEYRLKVDPGWKVEHIHDAPGQADNADNDDEAFKVSTPDGSVYWFGYGNGSNSVWTVPVYGNNSIEPCYNANTSLAWCQQGWQWNLDRVVDPSGNVTTYHYVKETNYYARFASTAAANRTLYTRAGVLDKITYGFDRTGTQGLPRDIVEIDSVPRCTYALTNLSATCTGANDPQNKPAIWPDVPGDLICDDASTCNNFSPSFFSTNRYSKVTTKTQKSTWADAVSQVVDTWTLGHTMPDPDDQSAKDEPDLWLNRIDRVGTSGSGTDTVPPVFFDTDPGHGLQNRIVVPAGAKAFKHFRVNSIRTETGGRIDVVYGHAPNMACDQTYVDGRARYNSARECFPQKYYPTGGTPHWEWFNKHVVTRIALSDDTLGYRYGQGANDTTKLGALRVFDYEYLGAPAWRYVSLRNVDDADQSWNDWRGYAQTIVHTKHTWQQTATADDVASRRVVVYRGMNGSRTNNDPDLTDSVQIQTVENAAADEPNDMPWMAGLVAEETQQDASGDPITRTYHDYGAILTASDNLGPDAHIVTEPSTKTTTEVFGQTHGKIRELVRTFNDGGSTHRQVRSGAVLTVQDRVAEDGVTFNDRTCTTTTWDASETDWIRKPQTVATYHAACGDMTGLSPEAKTTTYYDGDNNTANTIWRGLPTRTEVTTGPASGWDVLASTATYDSYGRILTSRDPELHLTSTDYNPTGSGHGTDGDLLTRVKTTLPTGLSVATDLDSRRGLPTDVTDASGNNTHTTYDGLGRTSAIVYPGDSLAHPSVSYDYRISTGKPSRVIESVLRDVTTVGGISTYVVDPSYAFFDGWGRTIEQQSKPIDPQGDGGGRIVTATGYDDTGNVRYQMSAFPNGNTDPAFDTVVNANPGTVPRNSIIDYDAAGRTTQVTQRHLDTDIAVATTDYLGDRIRSYPPAGGRTATILDGWDRTEQVLQYDDLEGTSLQDKATYTYTGTGQLDTITKDINGTRTWSYLYDWAGRRTKSIDPDTGTTTTSYDLDSNPETVTTGVGSGSAVSVTTSYDELDRPTGRTTGSGASLKTLAGWTYNGNSGNGAGQLHTATSYTDLGDFTTTITGYDNRGLPNATTYGYPAKLASTATGQASYTVEVSDRNKLGQPTVVAYPAIGGLLTTTVANGYGPYGAPTTSTATTPTTGGMLSATTLADISYNNIGVANEIDTHSGVPSDLGTGGINRSYAWDDGTGRLISLTGSTNLSSGNYNYFDLDYSYDAVGNPKQITSTIRASADKPAETGSWCYTYDGLNRLTQAGTGTRKSFLEPPLGTQCAPQWDTATVTGNAYQANYSYTQDRLTSLTLTTPDGNDGTTASTDTYNYPGAGANTHPHQLSNISNPTTPTQSQVDAGLAATGSATYDDAGRIKTWQPTAVGAPAISYTYDPGGNLATTTPAAGGPTIENAYDTNGLRVASQVSSVTTTTTPAGVTPVATVQNDTTTSTVYLGSTELTHTTGTATTTTEGASAEPVQTDTTSTVRQHATANGTPLASQTPGLGQSKWTWLLADLQHNIRFSTDGMHPHWYNYQPFGEPTPSTGLDSSGNLALEGNTAATAAPGARGYLNHQHEPNGDLHLDHRNYTPNLNLFLAPDPLLRPFDPQNLNAYSYSRNNPLAFVDPSGLGEAGVTAPDKEFGSGLGCDAACQKAAEEWRESQDQSDQSTNETGETTGGNDGTSASLNDGQPSTLPINVCFGGIPLNPVLVDVPRGFDEGHEPGWYKVGNFLSYRSYIDGVVQGVRGDPVGGALTGAGGTPSTAAGKGAKFLNDRWGSYGKHSERTLTGSSGKFLLRGGARVLSMPVSVVATGLDYMINPGGSVLMIVTSEGPIPNMLPSAYLGTRSSPYQCAPII